MTVFGDFQAGRERAGGRLGEPCGPCGGRCLGDCLNIRGWMGRGYRKKADRCVGRRSREGVFVDKFGCELENFGKGESVVFLSAWESSVWTKIDKDFKITLTRGGGLHVL